jgi:cytochrome c oxidase assembly protein subunit 15
MLGRTLWNNGTHLKLSNTLLGLCKSTWHCKLSSAANELQVGFGNIQGLGLRKFSLFPSAGLRPKRWYYPRNLRSYTAISPPRTKLARFLEPRFFSANSAQFAAPSVPLPVLSPPFVGRWLLVSSALVFAVIVVGGVTRLTESGLSITEWRPITGILPPLSKAEWEEEFVKYKATPEFKL